MHLLVLFGIGILAWGVRSTWEQTAASWLNARSPQIASSWERTLAIFLLPPLLLLTSTIAIIWMGPHGRMVWVGNDWISYDLALVFLGIATINWLQLASAGWQLLERVRTYPLVTLNGVSVRLLDLPTPYSAQIGFWKPELVISQSLLNTLDAAHLEAVLAHERAHHYYRDTWWFFWLGWVRQMTSWLPQTEALWQELLVLRELRADLWASERTDPLLVAEALLSIVQNTSVFPEDICAAFSQPAASVGDGSLPQNRLSRRIESLLSSMESTATKRTLADRVFARSWLLITLLPLLAVPFHC